MVIFKILAYVPPESLLYVCICFNVKINVSSKIIGKMNNMGLATRHTIAFRIPSGVHTYQTVALSKMLPFPTAKHLHKASSQELFVLDDASKPSPGLIEPRRPQLTQEDRGGFQSRECEEMRKE